MKDLMKTLASVKPSDKQKRWLDVGFYAFVHFGVNTFTDREWGLGNEDPKIFNPEKLDCDQWVEAIKSAGMKAMVLTCKHHDGFCLWPSKYTEHSLKNSPYKNGMGDIVKEASEACRKGGIKFGVYLSPWDRNSQYYGTPEYNDYYCNQLTELLTNYGEVFHVWFDGACGEGPNGKKQVYDFDRFFDVVHKYQPKASIICGGGPDIRWVGNEAGVARHSEWSVLPHELLFRAEKQTPPMPLYGDLHYINSTDEDLGNLETILYSEGLSYAPAEVDMSIRNGWFWHKNEEPHSLERLLRTYINSVGGNAGFNLNVPPTTDGLIDEKDVKRLAEFGELLRSEFGKNLAVNAKTTISEEHENGQSVIELDLGKTEKIKYVVLAEDLDNGQRVASFRINAPGTEHTKECLFVGTCIGHKKICPINYEGDKIMIHITSSRLNAKLMPIEIY